MAYVQIPSLTNTVWKFNSTITKTASGSITFQESEAGAGDNSIGSVYVNGTKYDIGTAAMFYSYFTLYIYVASNIQFYYFKTTDPVYTGLGLTDGEGWYYYDGSTYTKLTDPTVYLSLKQAYSSNQTQADNFLTQLQSNATQVTDLTNTKWVFKETGCVGFGSDDATKTFSVNYSVEEIAGTTIECPRYLNGQRLYTVGLYGNVGIYLKTTDYTYTSQTLTDGDGWYIYDESENEWNKLDTPPLILIQGGTDATNYDFITWLLENAEQQVGVSYSISVSATNLTYSGSTVIYENDSATVRLIASSGYRVPVSITVAGASYSYDSTTGIISLSNPTGNVTITAAGIAIKTYDVSNLGLSGGSHTIQVKARAAGYADSNFSNSATVNMLAAPGNMQINTNDGYLYFDEVPNATYYRMSVDETTNIIVTPVQTETEGRLKINLNSYLYSKDNGAIVVVSLTAHSSSGYQSNTASIIFVIDNQNYDGFYIQSLEDANQIKYTYYQRSSSYPITYNFLYYSYNGKYWYPSSYNTATLIVNKHRKVYFKGTGSWAGGTDNAHQGFTSSKTVNVGGHIMSLVNPNNYNGTMPDNCFNRLSYVYNSNYQTVSTHLKVVDASSLILPNITSPHCYDSMFISCNTLINAPTLPATTLASYCYYKMFQDCDALTTAPSLPATTLASHCYESMFYSCSSLVNAPTLPATTLAEYCYSNMFYGCSLTTAPTLPATTLTSYCYSYMFNQCYSLVNAPTLPATTLAEHCYNGMFSSCSLTTAPTLPATTLAEYCYSSMFIGCSSLVNAPTLPATTLATGCYGSMFSHCTSLTSAPSLPATTLATGCYSSMFYGCSLTTAPSLPATTLAASCYSSMFSHCTSLTSAPSLPATTLAEYCYSSMFSSCTSLTSAPSLPATTLASHCYESMFYSCSSLVNAPTLPAIKAVGYCYKEMFYGCSSLITAPALPATERQGTETVWGCYEGMFKNCTSLTTAPALPTADFYLGAYESMFENCIALNTLPALSSTILVDRYYQNMFKGCTSIKLSATQTGEYVNEYRIPTIGNGTSSSSSSLKDMFANTGGTFTGTPSLNTTYYTSNTIV